MKLIVGADEYVSQWVVERLPYQGLGLRGTAIGVVDRERIVAGVIFHSHQPEFASIEVSMAAITPRWASRAVIGSILSFPFEQLDCNRITAVTLRKSPGPKGASPRRFLKGLGFREEGLARDGFGRGKDAVIYGLLKTDWHANKLYGQSVGLDNVMAA